jgi:hypothetical protein
MKRLLCVFVGILAISTPVVAQTGEESRAHGYVFFAPGVTSPGGTGIAHLGGGGEALVYRGLGAGAELSYIAPWRAFGDGIGAFSPNASYHFRPHPGESKVTPFVTGGYTLLFRSGTANALNVGGGVTYWFRERMGLRFEVRDHIWPNGGTAHLVGFRVGLAFR